MISLSTHTGTDERPVSVRVDDLPEEERTLVRETLRLIKAMFDREDGARIMVGIAGCLGGIGMMPVLFHYLPYYLPKLSFMPFMAGVMAGAAVVGFMGWLITRAIVNRRHESDALLIRSHGAQSTRCSDLVREYSAVNPWFARALTSRTTQAVTA